MYCSPKHWIYYFKTTVYSLSLLFGQSSSNPCINKTLLLNSFSKSQFISCCPWSEVHCYLCLSPRHPISLFSVTCFELPITRTSFDFSWRFELSEVDCTGPCHPPLFDSNHANTLPVRKAAKFLAKLKEFWLKQTPAIRTRYYGHEGTFFGPDSAILLLDYSLCNEGEQAKSFKTWEITAAKFEK